MKKTQIFGGICLLAVFAAFTHFVRIFDVEAIGPGGTSVGFAHINQTVHDLTGVNMKWYDITDLIGYAALGVAGVFAVIGLVQLIRRKSLFKVDREIITLGILFIIVMGLYVGFEKFIINYRPVIMDGETFPEASYPSSHTMLIITVMGATSIVFRQYIKNGFLRGLLRFLCFAVIAVTVLGRLYCGVHWFTDIIGGLILSMGLLELYSGINYRERPRRAAGGDPLQPEEAYAGAGTEGSYSEEEYHPKH